MLTLLFSTAVVCPGTVATAGAPLAEVDGQAITAEEVDRALGARLQKLEEQIHTLRRQQLDALIGERLLAREAAKRGISVSALLDAEVTAKVGLVTEQEVQSFYQANKARLGGDVPSVRERIRSHLQAQKLAAQRDLLVERLRSQTPVLVHLKAPPMVRIEVSTDGAPFKGGAAAPVTIVEFSDFHCPFCKRVQGTLAELLSRYGDKVKLVYRDFPLDQLHPGARKAAEASRCAHEQAKFWSYHDALFAHAPKASPEDLKSYAQAVGLDVGAFEQCLASGRYQTAVQQDVEAGARAGVTGTPAFFINGRLLTGSLPLAKFVEVIDEALARAQ